MTTLAPISKVAILAAFLFIISACTTGSPAADSGSAGTSEVSAAEHSSDNEIIEASPVSSARLLDPNASANEIQASWPTYGDYAEFASNMDVVFVGSITGTTLNPLKQSPDPDDPYQSYIEWDGITFRVDEVLSGQLPKKGDEVQILQEVLSVIPDTFNKSGGKARVVPLRMAPIDIVAPGIRAADRGVSELPRYIVFAKMLPFDGENALTFFGPESVLEITNEGSIVPTKFTPPREVSAAENGYGVDISLDVIRDWINGKPLRLRPPLESEKPQPDEKPTDWDENNSLDDFPESSQYSE